ncbi:MAG TPA: hypothetical protein VE998_12540, partial [Terriglobales bacterium]|nr:hypothetical protein [Terriglobales bacterium]
MSVARIFADCASDAAPLTAHLRALGYTVELAACNSDAPTNADLEIRLERWPRNGALAEAQRRARNLGAEVFVAEDLDASSAPPAPPAAIVSAIRETPGNNDPLSRAVSAEAAELPVDSDELARAVCDTAAAPLIAAPAPLMVSVPPP